jgi:RsiW-degrading membrane proteinase PrsW (M82 family)
LSRTRTFLATELLLVGGLIAFVAVAFALERYLGLSRPVHLEPVRGLAVCLIPAGLWLGYFYLQDRHEPEPKHYVAGIYLLGAFVAPPVARFLTEVVFPVELGGGSRLGAANLVAAVLSVGLAQELAKLVVVRYTVCLSDEFDEPMDGIIYMTAAGVGFATAENYRYLLGLDTVVYLTPAAVSLVVNTLAHACFAGVMGYALGRAWFGNARGVVRNLTLLVGLLAAATLNGLFTLLERMVRSSSMQVHPWRGLAFAAAFAACVFFAVSLLMRQHLAASPHRR